MALYVHEQEVAKVKKQDKVAGHRIAGSFSGSVARLIGLHGNGTLPVLAC
jgi:hypothetical protein